MSTKFKMARRVTGFGTTIFSEINVLAQRHHAINLGQGAPDFDGPPEVLAAAVKAVNSEFNQYAPGLGMQAVREAIRATPNDFMDKRSIPRARSWLPAGPRRLCLPRFLVSPIPATK